MPTTPASPVAAAAAAASPTFPPPTALGPELSADAFLEWYKSLTNEHSPPKRKALLQSRLTATPKSVAIERQPASFAQQSAALLNSAKRKAMRTQQVDAANGLLDLWKANNVAGGALTSHGSSSALDLSGSNSNGPLPPPPPPPPSRRPTAPRNLATELARESAASGVGSGGLVAVGAKRTEATPEAKEKKSPKSKKDESPKKTPG